MAVKKRIVRAIGAAPIPEAGVEYRLVYIGIRNSVWWDSVRRSFMVVGNSVTKLMMRLGVQEQRARRYEELNEGTLTTAAVHRNELAGERTVKYAYVVRQEMCDQDAVVSHGGGFFSLGSCRRVVMCHRAWCDHGVPDADFEWMARELRKVKGEWGHWDDRRMLKVRQRMMGRRVIALACGSQLTRGERRRMREGGDFHPGSGRRGEFERHDDVADRRREIEAGPGDGDGERDRVGGGGSDRGKVRSVVRRRPRWSGSGERGGRDRPPGLPPRAGSVPPR